MSRTCKKCGAPMDGNRCEFCGYSFMAKSLYDPNRPITVKYLHRTLKSEETSELNDNVEKEKSYHIPIILILIVVVLITVIALLI